MSLVAPLNPPVPAQHGDECVCRSCAAGHYVDVLLRADYQRQEMSRMATEIAVLRRQLALSEYRRLTAETHLAVARDDKAAWAKAVAAKQGCDVPANDRTEIENDFVEVL